jgi:autotransporter-associated beta strand protein
VVVAGHSNLGSRVLTFNNAANSFTGGLYLNSAAVQFSDDAQLGAAGGGIVLQNGTVLYSQTGVGSISSARTIRIGEGYGYLETSNAAGTLSVEAKITGVGDLTKMGAGTLILGNAATDYQGTTVLRAGTTRLSAAAPPNNTQVILGTAQSATSAVLDLNGQNETIGGLQIARSNTGGSANLVTNTAATQSTLLINTASNSTYAGVFSGDIRLVKTGDGRFTVTAADSFNAMTGPIEVTAGRFTTTAGIGGCGSIQVSNTGSFGGAGTVQRGVVVYNDGTLTPGTSAGSMTFLNSLDLSDGGVFEWELTALTDNASSAGIDFDQVIVGNGGSVTLGGSSTIRIDVSSLATIDPNSNDPFWNSSHSWLAIDLQNGGFNAGGSDFANILNSSFARGTFTTSVDLGRIFIHFNVSPVPEPGALGLTFGAALLAVAGRVFRRGD